MQQPSSSLSVNDLVDRVYQQLLPQLQLESPDPHNPVVVHALPAPWQLLGTGNYAAVFCHPQASDWVVKVYAPGRPGLEAEVQVYQRLGTHPAFSSCYFAGDTFLVLKRLKGITLYDALNKGLPIPRQVIDDIDAALDYARHQGLFPHDVHGRNVMMLEGQGLVVDVSDFLHQDPCTAWYDLKRAYYWFYRPILRPLRLRVPYPLLDGVRVGYRWFRRLFPRRQRARLQLLR